MSTKVNKISDNPQAVYMSRLFKTFFRMIDAYENYLEECIDASSRSKCLSCYCLSISSFQEALILEWSLYNDEFCSIPGLVRLYKRACFYDPYSRWFLREKRFFNSVPTMGKKVSDEPLPF